MRFSFTRLVFWVLLVGLASSFYQAQIGQTNGRLQGEVKDQSGAVIPGVTVTLSSYSGTKTAITSDTGLFDFPFLSPGMYNLKAELSGFKIYEQNNITIRLGIITTLNFMLTPGELSETVTVTGEAPLLDTTTTIIGANIPESLYTSIPIRRNFTALFNLAPGVSDSGNIGSANPSISGGSGLENNYVVDGINITNAGFGGLGTYSNFLYGSLGSGVNFDFVKEVQVKAGGFEAEYGQSTGGVVNVITKSGGNDFHGGAYFYGQPAGFQTARRQPNIFRVVKSTETLAQDNYDFGFDLSGYMRKDKLFFYLGFDPSWSTDFNHAPTGYGQDVDGLKLYQQHSKVYSWCGKVTYVPHSNHVLEFSAFADPSETGMGPNRDMSIAGDGAYSKLNYGSWNWIGRYNGVLRPDWFLTVSVGRAYNRFEESFLHGDQPASWDFVQFFYDYYLPMHPGADPDNISYLVVGGPGNIMNNEGENWQFNVKGSHNFNALGKHSLDYGYAYEKINFSGYFGYSGPDFNIPAYPDAGFSGAVSHGAWVNHMWLTPNLLDPRNPDNHPIDLNRDGKIDASDAVYWQIRGLTSDPLRQSHTNYHSLYVQDAWKITNRLTLKGGLRYDYQRMEGKEESYTFGGYLSPRFGLIYDVEGDGKSKAYGSWGRFYEKIPNDLALRAFNGETMLTNVFWADPNFTVFLNPILGIPYVGQVGGTVPLLKGTESMYQDEFILGYERELNPTLVFGVRYIYRDLKRVLETIGNLTVEQVYAGLPLTYFIGNPSYKVDYFNNQTGDLGADGQPDGYGDPKRSYNALEISLEKRLAKGIQFMVNYRFSKLWGNYEGLYRNDNQQDDPNLSSLFDFRNSSILAYQYVPGYLNTDREHVFNLNGSYTFPSRMTIGVGARLNSGAPLTPLGTQPVYKSDGEVALKTRGSDGRGDWINTVDMHADYPFRFGDSYRLRFALDMFNVFNRKQVVNYDQQYQLSFVSNPDYLTATSFQRPFNARFSIRFEF